MVRKVVSPQVNEVSVPVKRRVAKKKAAGPRRSKAVREGQERAVKWAVAYGAPIAMLSGWDPKTGLWAKGSPVGDMLIDIRESGLPLAAAAKRHDVRRVGELVARGNEYLSDEELSEDRMLILVGQRAFVDLTLQVRFADAEAEFGPVEVLYKAALENPRDALAYLARRFPERWRDQPDVMQPLEEDPRDVAVHQLLQDPNMAMKMAAVARQVADLAAAADPDAP